MPENLPLSLLAPDAPRELRNLPTEHRLRLVKEASDRRADDRYCGSALGLIAVTVTRPDSPPLRARVPVLDVSTTGISFLHPAAIAPGCRCVFDLPGAFDDDADATVGTAVRCRSLGERVHEVGVRFTHPVDVARLTAAALSEHNAQ